MTAVMTLFSSAVSWGIEKRMLDEAGVQKLDQQAPAFTVIGDDGRKTDLKDLRGKVVILHIWATWCQPCKDEFPLFERIYNEYGDKGIMLMPVAIDKKATRDEIKGHAKAMGATFPVYLAKDGDVTDKYWTWGVPATYFIDKNGWIRARAIGPRDWGSEKIKAVIEALAGEK